MSLSQLQTAAATLVRFPEEGRGDAWEMFATQFDLTPGEQVRLHSIAQNLQVTKYGNKLRYFRFSDTIESLPHLEAVLGEDLFRTLWFDCFEPNASGVSSENLTQAFLTFLRSDREATTLLAKEAPPYAVDFIHFFHAENSLEQCGELWRLKDLPDGSLLAHGAVYPMRFDYDVPQTIKKMADAAFDLDGIEKRAAYYVFALKENAASPSLFAVDKEVFEFLNDQLVAPLKCTNLPTVYADLVKAGICTQKP